MRNFRLRSEWGATTRSTTRSRFANRLRCSLLLGHNLPTYRCLLSTNPLVAPASGPHRRSALVDADETQETSFPNAPYGRHQMRRDDLFGTDQALIETAKCSEVKAESLPTTGFPRAKIRASGHRCEDRPRTINTECRDLLSCWIIAPVAAIPARGPLLPPAMVFDGEWAQNWAQFFGRDRVSSEHRGRGGSRLPPLGNCDRASQRTQEILDVVYVCISAHRAKYL